MLCMMLVGHYSKNCFLPVDVFYLGVMHRRVVGMYEVQNMNLETILIRLLTGALGINIIVDAFYLIYVHKNPHGQS